MAIKTVLLILGIAIATGGGLFVPLLGVLGYMTHYNIGVERQWWATDIKQYGLRLSLMLAGATAIGCVLHMRSLRVGRSWLLGNEKLILAFLGLVWLSVALGTGMREVANVDHPAVKFTKLVVFLFMLTHVVTTLRSLNWLMWTLVAGALVLGLEARGTGYFGRLENVGGPDFADSNALAAYIAALLPIIAIQFVRSGWIGRGICAISAAFAVNTIVLCRSRGALVGIAAGALAALLLAPGKHRLKIIGGLLITLVAFVFLGNPAFWSRAQKLGGGSGKEVDPAAQSRLDVWEGGKKMLMDHPQGVGAGNFSTTIGRYAPEHEGRDAHNTFVRGFCELGVQGGLMLIVILIATFKAYRDAHKQANSLPLEQRRNLNQFAYAMLVGLVIFLTSGLTGTLLYVESFWWLLALPICLLRAVDNAHEDMLATEEDGKTRRGGNQGKLGSDADENEEEDGDRPGPRKQARRSRSGTMAFQSGRRGRAQP